MFSNNIRSQIKLLVNQIKCLSSILLYRREENKLLIDDIISQESALTCQHFPDKIITFHII